MRQILIGSGPRFARDAVLASLAWAFVFLGSAIVGRPLAGLFAAEMYPFPPEVRASRTFQRVFSIVSIVWGATRSRAFRRSDEWGWAIA